MKLIPDSLLSGWFQKSACESLAGFRKVRVTLIPCCLAGFRDVRVFNSIPCSLAGFREV